MLLHRALATLPRRVRAVLSKFGANAHLYLPAAQTPVLGPELVTNGDFSSDTAWTKVNTVIAGGIATTTGISSFATMISQTIAFVQGKSYQYTITSAKTSGSNLSLSTGAQTIASGVGVTGTYSGVFIANVSSASPFYVWENSGGTWVGSIDNISVREILSYSDTISGFHSGNYQDSTGTTPQVVDQPVGLVLDAAGSVGSELHGTVAYTQVSGTAWSQVGNTMHCDGSIGQCASACLVAGKTYKFTFTSSTPVNVYLGGSTYLLGQTGTVTWYGVATGNVSIMFQNTGVVAAYDVTNISVREITGLHASQATTGNKPTVRRGIVNQTYYSNDLSNASWTKAGSPTVAAGSLTRTSTGATYLAGSSASKAAASLPFTQAGVFSAGTGRYAVLRLQGTYPNYVEGVFDLQTGVVTSSALNGTFTNKAASIVQVEAGKYLCVVSATTDTALVAQPHISVNSNATVLDGTDSSATSSMNHYGSATFAGTLTASEILSYGGIPLTTTAAASSTSGNYYGEYVAANSNYLSIGAAQFQLSDDFAVVASVTRTGDSGAWQTVFSQYGNGTRFQLCFEIGKLTAYMSDGLGAILQLTFATPTQLNTPYVISVRKVGASVKLRQNGVEVGSGTFSPSSAPQANISLIGSYNATDFFLGKISEVSPIKGAVSDSDLIMLEKFAVQRAGGVLIDGQFISSYNAFALNAANGNPTLDLDFTNQTYSTWSN